MNTLPNIEFLSVQEVAHSLGVSKMSIYRLIHGEGLRAYRVGKVFRIDPRDVVKYMQGVNTVERRGGVA